MYDDAAWYLAQLNNYKNIRMEFEELYKTYWQKIFRLCMGYVMIMTL
jgi:hypothetical protein